MARGSIFGNSFKGIDAFGKTLDDVKVKTRTGALLTIMSMGAILLMIINEFIDYRHVFLDTSVVVDKTRGSRVTLNFNMTFPRVPCYLLSLDVTDISGEHLRDISHHVVKTRLDNRMVPIPDLPTVFNSDLGSDLAKATANKRQGYCGSCYGGLEPESGCCNSCEEVRQAYVNKGWSFGNPEAIDQCVNEGWVEKLQAQKDEACNVAGRIRIHKVMSTLQISPGRSFQTNAMHMHDIVPYLKDGMNHHFGHVIHKFQFQSDDEYSEDRAQKAKDLKKRLGAEVNPLDGVVGNAHMDKGKFMFQYFVKVVSTAFHTLQNERISTQQYSVTNFQRNLEESDRGENPDGTAFMHGTDALLGVFFNIEISPMLVMHTEKRHTLATFLTGVCAIVGGVLTVAGLLDAAVFQSLKSLTGGGGN